MKYNKYDRLVDLGSEDFRNVLEYLNKQGLPNPSDIRVEKVGMPAGPSYTNQTLVWKGIQPAPFEIDAYMVMNWPSATVRFYRQWAQLPEISVPEYEPPKPPPPPPAPDYSSKLANEGRPGYRKRTNGFFTWWEPE
jgi:hypothetical protein